MHRLRASCSNPPLCHNLLSRQIRSYSKTLFVYRIDCIVMPLRRYVIRSPCDKSDRIGIETCYVFHCAAVSSSDIFGAPASIALYWGIALKNFFVNLFSCAKFKQLFQKYPMMTQRRSETHTTSLCQYDLICPDGDV